MNGKATVLHLTDLHFGLGMSVTAQSQRTNALDELLSSLTDLESEWSPDVIVVSGDIGWQGTGQDYERAKEWLAHLCRATSLTPDRLITCAGNHDVDRTRSIRQYPSTATEADDLLAVDAQALHSDLTPPFESYTSLCAEFGIPSLSLGEGTFSLMGHRVVSDLDLRFVILNSAWFSHSNEDAGKLWMGLPQLQVMNAYSQVVKPDAYDEDLITIAVVHHPDSSMNPAENSRYGRPATYRYLAERCHIILTGHEHGEPIKPHRYQDGAYLFKGGASYIGDRYKNNFSIFQFHTESRTVTQRVFEYNPGTQEWIERQDIRGTYSLYREHVAPPDSSIPRGRLKEGKISIEITDQLQERNLLLGLRHVQDGIGEHLSVLNEDRIFRNENGNKYSVTINYAERLGFQFKCFAHYGSGDFAYIKQLLEEAGFDSVSQDYSEPRAWFLLPGYAVYKARGNYDNNIFYPS